MSYIQYRGDSLYIEGIAAEQLTQQYGSPLYVYSKSEILSSWHQYADAMGDSGLVCYAVKACSNLSVLKLLAEQGSGFDIVSIGELQRVLAAGGNPGKVVFSGVAKQADEMEFALKAGILCFNVESESELYRLNEVAGRLNITAPVSIRVNPDVDAKTHPYISTGLKQNKFGIDIALAEEVYQKASQLAHIDVKGIDCHIGSQITELEPFLDALDRLLVLTDRLREQGISLNHLDLGGGIGVSYEPSEDVPDMTEYLDQVREKIGSRSLKIILEPGRSIVAKAGTFLTRVIYLKSTQEHNFAIVDGGMNDLIRPALYQAWQEVVPVQNKNVDKKVWDIVGPICETGDFLAHERLLGLEEGDLVAVKDSGAYGFTMASNYNSRNRTAEVLVDGTDSKVIRQRESIEDQLALEKKCLEME